MHGGKQIPKRRYSCNIFYLLLPPCVEVNFEASNLVTEAKGLKEIKGLKKAGKFVFETKEGEEFITSRVL